jgi:preprotein translocase subunit SecG
VIKHGTCWQILEIDPTDNKREIKQAYARLLKVYHPEEYPEEFKRLENAYKEAIQYKKEAKSTYTMDSSILHEKENIDIKNIDFSEQTVKKKDYSIHLNDTIVVQEEKKKDYSIHLKEDVDDKDYILKKARVLLENNPSIITLDKIFNDKDVIKYLYNPEFKKQIEVLLNDIVRLGDIETNTYIKQKAQMYHLTEVSKKTEQVNKKIQKRTRFNKSTIYVFIFFIVLAVIMGIINSMDRTTKSTNSQDERQQAIDRSIRESQNNSMLEVSKTFCDINSSYLNGIQVDTEGGNVTLKDEEGNNLITEEITSFSCKSTSPLIALKIEGMYQIYDTTTRSFYPFSYQSYAFVSIEENGVIQAGIRVIVLDNDGSWYLLSTLGEKELLIDASISVSNTTQVIRMQDGNIIE